MNFPSIIIFIFEKKYILPQNLRGKYICCKFGLSIKTQKTKK